MTPQLQAQFWGERADAAEAAIAARHLRRLWGIPGCRLGVVDWPASYPQQVFITWDYWWQAHLIDCAVDAADRAPTPLRRVRIAEVARGLRIRNLTGWTNSYYDDMAWLTLALDRAQHSQQLDYRGPVHILSSKLESGWNARHGAIPWRVGVTFFNTPANGPAAIAFARSGLIPRATEIADWIAATLGDPATGLIFDGITFTGETSALATTFYTYCQGVTIGLDTELAVRTGHERFLDRAAKLIGAVENHLTDDGVIHGQGGGDGGLFAGILARYLALAAVMLPGDTSQARRARARAASMVLSSAEAAWSNRLEVDGNPIFGEDWRRAAVVPGTRTAAIVSERDLSVQLSGWMLMEAAARLAAAGFTA